MTVNGINGANMNSQSVYSMGKAMDSASQNIQKQIENAQKQLQELSSNEEMTLEQKMEKRQEIQKQITELNQQLRQQQIDARKEAQQKSGTTMDDMLGANNKGKKGAAGSGMSSTGMQAMISADVSMKQAQVQGSVATDMKGKANILEQEIKMDKAMGQNTEKKEEELAKLQKNAQEATYAQISTLAEASKTMDEAAEEEQSGKAEEAAGKESKKTVDGQRAEDSEDTAGSVKAGTPVENPEMPVQKPEAPSVENGSPEPSQPLSYTPIDVRL